MSEIKYVVATLFKNHKLFLVLLKSIFTITRPVWLSSLNPSLSHTHITHSNSKSVNLGIYHRLYLWHANNVSISNQCRHGYIINYKLTKIFNKADVFNHCFKHISIVKDSRGHHMHCVNSPVDPDLNKLFGNK
jgi:hypothetical protein